jgi:hypothetical protein
LRTLPTCQSLVCRILIAVPASRSPPNEFYHPAPTFRRRAPWRGFPLGLDQPVPVLTANIREAPLPT